MGVWRMDAAEPMLLLLHQQVATAAQAAAPAPTTALAAAPLLVAAPVPVPGSTPAVGDSSPQAFWQPWSFHAHENKLRAIAWGRVAPACAWVQKLNARRSERITRTTGCRERHMMPIHSHSYPFILAQV